MSLPVAPDLLRRRLLTALALTPLLPALPAMSAALPDAGRVVALEWLPTELLLTLGVTPLGVAEIRNYRLWVGEPALPATVLDLGSRTEPNIELLQQLRPSLVLCSADFGPSTAMLERIAPVQRFVFNDGSGQPLALSITSLQRLAATLGLEMRCRSYLTSFEQRMDGYRERLRPWRGLPLLLFTLLDANHALVFGRGSLFQDVLERLSLNNAWHGNTNFWGSAVVSLEQLATIGEAQGVFFSHGNDALLRQVQQTPLWQALPFVRRYPLKIQPAVWFYGGTLSAMRFCDLLSHALETPS